MGLWQSEKESNSQGFMGLWASSNALNSVFKIPLITSQASVPSGLVSTYTRNSTATYIEDGLVKTAEIDVIIFQNGRYLCEPAATNSFTYSGDLSLDITDANNLVSDPIYQGPFSNVNANLIDLTSGVQYIYKTISLVAGTYCFSHYIKLGSAPSVGYGLYSVTNASWISQEKYTGLSTVEYKRVSTTFTLATNQIIRVYFKRYIDATTLGTSYHFGGQLELGTSPTSYIPTTSAPITRAANALHYAVGDVITQGQGSLYCEGVVKFFGLNQRLLNLSDNSTANCLYITLLANASLAAYVVSAGTVQTSISFGVPTEGDVVKCLLTYKDNNVSFYVNGVAVGTDITCQIPIVLNKLSVGCSHDSTLQLGDEVGNIKYFKEVLTPAPAIKLTTL